MTKEKIHNAERSTDYTDECRVSGVACRVPGRSQGGKFKSKLYTRHPALGIRELVRAFDLGFHFPPAWAALGRIEQVGNAADQPEEHKKCEAEK